MPEVCGERPEFTPQFKRPRRIVYDRFDLSSMPHDACIRQEPRDIGRVICRYNSVVKGMKRVSKALTLLQDSPPAEACLKSFETELLEQPRIIPFRQPPFRVMVGQLFKRRLGPAASGATVGGNAVNHESPFPALLQMNSSPTCSRRVDLGNVVHLTHITNARKEVHCLGQ